MSCGNNMRIEENAAWLKQLIIDYVNESSENNLGGGYNEKAWGEPLVGFSKGDDPYYTWLKQDIGDFYLTPCEIFSKTFPTAKANPLDLSVICWILPQTEATKADMGGETKYPAERAALSRVNGEAFNLKVGQHVVHALKEHGFEAVAPAQSEYWEVKTSEKYGVASSWSEKHAAFVSGLGTFSLTDTLITEFGTAVRIGSVVSKIQIEPTERKYSKYNEYCLHFSKGGCMKCAERCPASAINEKGHDKIKCREYLNTVASKYIDVNYKITTNFCGLCQFGVPCESCIPK